MDKVKKVLCDEFVAGKKWYDWAVLGTGLALQAAAIAVGFASGEPESLGLIVAGLSGVIGTVLCSQGKISFYAFGFLQTILYVLCFSLPNRLHGETIENGMYFVTMIYGVWAWARRYRKDAASGSTRIEARKLGLRGNLVLLSVFAALVVAYWQVLANVPMFGSMDSDPFIDSLTSVPAYFAQILMVAGFREQWLYWLILDVGSVAMAARAGSLVMTAQFAFWCLNCLYGYWNWTRSAGASGATGGERRAYAYAGTRVKDWKGRACERAVTYAEFLDRYADNGMVHDMRPDGFLLDEGGVYGFDNTIVRFATADDEEKYRAWLETGESIALMTGA